LSDPVPGYTCCWSNVRWNWDEESWWWSEGDEEEIGEFFQWWIRMG